MADFPFTIITGLGLQAKGQRDEFIHTKVQLGSELKLTTFFLQLVTTLGLGSRIAPTGDLAVGRYRR